MVLLRYLYDGLHTILAMNSIYNSYHTSTPSKYSHRNSHTTVNDNKIVPVSQNSPVYPAEQAQVKLPILLTQSPNEQLEVGQLLITTDECVKITIYGLESNNWISRLLCVQLFPS